MNMEEYETKRTAVEWFMDMLVDCKYLNKDASHLFEEAKKIEQRRLEVARIEGMQNAFRTTNELLRNELNKWKKLDS